VDFRAIYNNNLNFLHLSDKLFRTMADRLVSEGYAALGYRYLMIDDCWLSKDRDAQGRLQPDPDRFPYGMKDLAAYVIQKSDC
jgi:Alpha galactosidase A